MYRHTDHGTFRRRRTRHAGRVQSHISRPTDASTLHERLIASPWPTKCLGRYSLGRIIGKGSDKVVWEACDRSRTAQTGDCPFVLQVQRTRTAADREQVERE